MADDVGRMMQQTDRHTERVREAERERYGKEERARERKRDDEAVYGIRQRQRDRIETKIWRDGELDIYIYTYIHRQKYGWMDV